MNASNDTWSQPPSPLSSELLYRLRSNLCVYVYPVIVVVGLICNTLAMLVLTRSAMRRNPASLCLTVLAVADSCALIFGASRYWTKYALDFDPQVQHLIACRILLFLEYYAADCSAWILCVVTLQRFVLTRVPLQVADLCSYKRTALFLIIVAVAMAAKNSPFLWIARISPLPLAGQLCQVIWKPKFWAVYSWVDLLVRLLIPFVLMLVLNITTAVRVKRAVSSRRRMSAAVYLAQPRRISTNNPNAVNERRAPTRSSFGSNDDRNARRMRAMLFAVNAAFLVAYAPFATLMTVDGVLALFRKAIITGNVHQYALLAFLFQSCLTLAYASNAANFFLYMASGAKFRSTLAVMCGRKEPRLLTRASAAQSIYKHQ